MPTPYRKARLMGRLTLFATTLVAADLGMSLDAAPPIAASPEMPAAAPDWNGSQMLLAGTGLRGGKFNSLFSRKKSLPRENGEDFIRPDFEDFVGPAGRRTSNPRITSGLSNPPAAVPPAAVPPEVTDLDTLPPLDLDLPDVFAPVAQQQSNGVPPVPSLNGETTPATQPQSKFRLTKSSDYEPVTLSEAELFPADSNSIATSTAKTEKKSRNNFLNLFPDDAAEDETSSNAIASEFLVDIDEQWPADLYPEPEMGLMIDEPLIAADETTVDPLLDLPSLDLVEADTSTPVATPAAAEMPAAVPPALELANIAESSPETIGDDAEYWQTPRQVSADASGWTALQRGQQQEQWRAAGSAYEANRSTPPSTNGWVASTRSNRHLEPAGIASTKTAHVAQQHTNEDVSSQYAAAPVAKQPSAPPQTVAMSPLAKLPPVAAPAAVEQIPAHTPHVDGVDNAFSPGEETIAANESLDLTPPPMDMTPTSEHATSEAKVAKTLTNREGLTGLKGFCPVTLCEHRDLVDADPRFAAVYNDRTYYVSTYEALLQFQEDPEKYAPVVRGLDVVALARDGVEIDGILDHAAWYRGQLYLFATADLLAEFSANPRTYAIQ